MGAFYPFDRDRFFRALAWLIMHKIVYPSVIARLIVHKITFYASLRAVTDGAAIHALLVAQPRCFARLWIASRPLRARSQ
jgi:hypothetical protein